MARELILTLCDFFSLDEESHAARGWPRLPALERLLASARREPQPDGWRGRLARTLGGSNLAAAAPATAAAMAWLPPAAPPARQYWFATPVHYFAGLDSLRLHPAGLLTLATEAQAALVQDFSRVFGDAPWRLHSIGARELLLSGEPLDASGEDPARYLGGDPADGLPHGAQAATLRRLSVEMEMWLHEHAVNLARQGRGELVVSGLWLWGALPLASGAASPAVQLVRPDSARLYGADCHIEALWRLAGGAPSQPLPEAFDSGTASAMQTQLVLYPLIAQQSDSNRWQQLEQHWLAPALVALREGKLSAIHLLANRCGFHMRRLHLARFWRRASPWWERLA
jgi:hypothetical protein